KGTKSKKAPGFLVSRPALAGAGVGLVFATIFCPPARRGKDIAGGFVYRSAREAHLIARAQLGYYRSVGLPLVRSAAELEEHVRGWRPGRLAALLLMEGADPIETPAQVGEWVRAGVRAVGLSWARTRYAGGTGAPGGLTEEGVRLLRSMRRRGLILDLSHLADQSISDALGLWTGPVMASHSNSRAVTGRQRELPDQVLAELARRGGVAGVSFYRSHLGVSGRAGPGDVVRMVRRLADATGGPEHVGIGSDLDGGFGADRAPIRGLGELPALGGLLERHFSPAQVEGILGLNWIEFLRRSLPAAA
ncbi:MAG: dipeptidase, partial [Candidatus Dormibacteraceae bacterium]